ncbi:MAG: flavin monoamine oxidase family protein [Aestuariivirga sp.]|uniref:flavin monoamine oxidase family protein n=1 Tax=Aestuariivirga sp. TaxID=2650926 RepID=UPI0038D0A99B
MSHYDIAVIGAGAAGLAAGLALQASGRSFIVLEARDRIGGRAYTDTATLGLPFDCGAHWLHAAAQNPFTTIADRLGFAYNARLTWADVIRYGGGGPLPDAVQKEGIAHIIDVLTRISETDASGPDRPFSAYLDPGNRWYLLLEHIINQITSHDPEDCSVLDYARYVEEGGDFPVADGFGALVARHAAALAVTLSTPVTCVDWSGRQVRLETPNGTVTAQTIILAVPVNVLIAGGIRFDPALPVSLVEAFHDCPMGVSEKLAILLDRPIDGLGHLYGDVIFPDPAKRPFNLHTNPFGRPLLVSHMGGSHGREVERLSDAAVEAMAMEAVTEAFGASFRKRVKKMLRTHWASDPYTLGGYSHARPGRAASRLLFSEPVADRIVLAGEHCSIPFFSTVHGAHLSGIDAAAKALRLVDGQPASSSR